MNITEEQLTKCAEAGAKAASAKLKEMKISSTLLRVEQSKWQAITLWDASNYNKERPARLAFARAAIEEYERQRESELDAAKDTIAGLEKANGELEQEIRNLSKPTSPQPPPGYHLATAEELLKLPEGSLCVEKGVDHEWSRSGCIGEASDPQCDYACPDLPDEGAELVTARELTDPFPVYELAFRINARHRERVAALKLARDTDWQHWQGEKAELEERLAALTCGLVSEDFARELERELTASHARESALREAAEKLNDAIGSVQDWTDTYVGECMDLVESAIHQPSPPVVPLAIAEQLAEALNAIMECASEDLCGCSDEDLADALENGYAPEIRTQAQAWINSRAALAAYRANHPKP